MSCTIIKLERVKQCKSQMTFAKELGVNKDHLNAVENRRTKPSWGLLVRICTALELPFGAVANDLNVTE